MADTIRRVEVIPVRVPRETPYLGQLEHGVVVSDEGYFVRPGNRSVYNISDQSTLVRIESESGAGRLGRMRLIRRSTGHHRKSSAT